MTDDRAAIDRICAEIAAERRRQVARWGRQDHPSVSPDSPESPAVHAERAEAWKAVNDGRRAGEHSWDAILLEEVYEALAETDDVRRRAELLQVAAVAAAEIEAIDWRLGR